MKVIFGTAALFAVLLISSSMPSVAQSESLEYVIVANKQVPGTSINLASLKAIYLREVRTWANGGGEIVPVDLTSYSGFYQNLFGKNQVQMQAYWLNMRIKHNIDLPVSKKDAESAKRFIAENKGAIGFLKNSDIDDSVKVIKLTD
jgi:ABC-type phosphate transport system substrate-binding protein